MAFEASDFFDREWIYHLFVNRPKAASSAQRNELSRTRTIPVSSSLKARTMDRLKSASEYGSAPSDISLSSLGWSRSSSSNSSGADSECSSTPTDIEFPADYRPDELEMRRVFERMDENDDGLVCVKDLNRFMARFGYRMLEDEVATLVRSVCREYKGMLDFEKFYSLFESLTSCGRKSEAGVDAREGEDDKEEGFDDDEEMLDAAFKVFDKNSDGVITALELQQVLLDLGMPEGHSLRKCERMIEKVDNDGNGLIDINEFKALMCSRCFQVE